MRLHLDDDQRQVLDAVDALARSFASDYAHEPSYVVTADDFDRELEESGFLDVMNVEELGAVTAALVTERLARLPFAVEAAASALVRPAIDLELPRPFCLVRDGKLAAPVRFLRPGATVLVIGDGEVRSFTATHGQISPSAADSLYAYPVAFLSKLPYDMREHDISPAEILRLWRVALAAEIAGLLAAALDCITAYLSDRKQFGRPLATFQALRHRLAEVQVATNGVYWMALKAAGTSDPGDAALAALMAQESARRGAYDFHQLMGAMGMTLEHPMHVWTYRMKLLTAELGGQGAQAMAAAKAIWG